MEVIDRQQALITNYEALLVLRELDQQIEADKDKQKQKQRGKDKKGNQEIKPRHPENVTTLKFEALEYLEKTACVSQSAEQIAQLREWLQEYELTRAEILQFINLRPTSPVELHLLVESYDERFLDGAGDELIALVKEALPREDDNAPEDEAGDAAPDAMDVDENSG
ncbi:hypothetical protein IWW50_005234 [Coemansia erecta]|nr:hypothetical protein GGF43_003577 [Coemansia sp. RSA 2618]KAJ2820013.1 hypothetical protein IWW50_005234 [Coemansia erecta]